MTEFNCKESRYKNQTIYNIETIFRAIILKHTKEEYLENKVNNINEKIIGNHYGNKDINIAYKLACHHFRYRSHFGTMHIASILAIFSVFMLTDAKTGMCNIYQQFPLLIYIIFRRSF